MEQGTTRAPDGTRMYRWFIITDSGKVIITWAPSTEAARIKATTARGLIVQRIAPAPYPI